MIRCSGQFGSFDGFDNRRDVMRLLARLSQGVPESIGCQRRRAVLVRLMALSTSGFAGKPVDLGPLSTVEAYFAFTALTGCLGVPVEEAAKRLEDEVRKYEKGDPMVCRVALS